MLLSISLFDYRHTDFIKWVIIENSTCFHPSALESKFENIDLMVGVKFIQNSPRSVRGSHIFDLKSGKRLHV